MGAGRALEHRDSAGNSGVVYPGLAQRMSAGTGIFHSEKNASATEPVRFVQMWVQPDASGVEPGYQHQDVSNDLLDGQLVAIASGIPGHGAAITINNRSATLHVAQLRPGDEVTVPSAPYLHLFIARGQLAIAEAELAVGDAVRLTGSPGAQVAAREPAEILVWEMHAVLGD